MTNQKIENIDFDDTERELEKFTDSMKSVLLPHTKELRHEDCTAYKFVEMYLMN